MNFLNSVFKSFRLRLTENDRSIIWKAFGSFRANQFAMDDSSLIANSYEKNAEVFGVIKRIVDVTKSVPWVVEQYTGGRWKELTDTPFHALMENPNPGKNYTWDDIEEQILIYLLCTGNVYLVGETPFMMNEISEIDVLPSPAVCIETNDNFFLPELKYKFSLGKNNRTFTKENLSHIKLFNPSYSSVTESFYGLSIIQVAANVIQVSNDRWDANAALLQNRGAIGLISDKSERPLTEPQAIEIQSAFDKMMTGTDKFGKVKVTNKDLNYISMAMSATDLELIKTGVVNLRAICNVFGLDSSLFNDPENKTFANRAEAEKAFYTNAVIPTSTKISENLTRFLVPSLFPGSKKVRLRQDFSKIEVLQESFNTKATTFVSLVQAGVIDADVAAEKLGLPKKKEPNNDAE